MAVRSKRLAIAEVVPPSQTVYTSPPDETTIVKSCALYNAGPLAVAYFVAADNPGAPGGVRFLTGSLAAGVGLYADVWIVLQPADVINVGADLVGLRVYLSGAQLEGVAD